MAKDVGDVIGAAIGRVARETVQTVAANSKKRGGGVNLSGGRGLAAGAGLASLAPVAYKGAKRLMSGSSNGSNPIGKAKSKVEDNVKGKVEGNVKDKAKEGVKDALPFGGGGNKNEEAGVGKGRRMPIQQSMDIGAPLKTVYNEWTQFEEWPSFMHRLESVNQEDETTVHFKTKIWGKSKEFTAEILEQVPDKLIKWEVTEGVTHTGVVTFSEVADNLTHVELNMDVQPGSLIEKAARGMRHVKRAVRADMHRFKAHVMMNQEEHGAWRGTIEDGDVKRTRSRSASSGSKPRSRSASSGSKPRSRSASSGSKSRSGSASSGSKSRSGGSSARSGGSSSKSGGSSARSSGSSSKSGGSSARSSGSSSKSSGSSARGSGSTRSRSSSNGRTTASRSSRSSSNGRKKAGSRS